MIISYCDFSRIPRGRGFLKLENNLTIGHCGQYTLLFYKILPWALNHECDGCGGDEDADDDASEDGAESGGVTADSTLSDVIDPRRRYVCCHQRHF